MKHSKDVEGRWKVRCGELEKEVTKLKKESDEFYSTDKFSGQFDPF